MLGPDHHDVVWVQVAGQGLVPEGLVGRPGGRDAARVSNIPDTDRAAGFDALVIPVLRLIHSLDLNCALQLLKVHMPTPDMSPVQRWDATYTLPLV